MEIHTMVCCHWLVIAKAHCDFDGLNIIILLNKQINVIHPSREIWPINFHSTSLKDYERNTSIIKCSPYYAEVSLSFKILKPTERQNSTQAGFQRSKFQVRPILHDISQEHNTFNWGLFDIPVFQECGYVLLSSLIIQSQSQQSPIMIPKYFLDLISHNDFWFQRYKCRNQ